MENACWHRKYVCVKSEPSGIAAVAVNRYKFIDVGEEVRRDGNFGFFLHFLRIFLNLINEKYANVSILYSCVCLCVCMMKQMHFLIFFFCVWIVGMVNTTRYQMDLSSKNHTFEINPTIGSLAVSRGIIRKDHRVKRRSLKSMSYR